MLFGIPPGVPSRIPEIQSAISIEFPFRNELLNGNLAGFSEEILTAISEEVYVGIFDGNPWRILDGNARGNRDRISGIP